MEHHCLIYDEAARCQIDPTARWTADELLYEAPVQVQAPEPPASIPPPAHSHSVACATVQEPVRPALLLEEPLAEPVLRVEVREICLFCVRSLSPLPYLRAAAMDLIAVSKKQSCNSCACVSDQWVTTGCCVATWHACTFQRSKVAAASVE